MVRRVLIAMMLVALTSCGGGGNTSSVPIAPASSKLQSVGVNFSIVIPSSTARKIQYVSAATNTVTVVITPAGSTANAPQTIPCTGSQCSGTVQAPIGTSQFAVSLLDSRNNVLSQGTTTATIVEGQANSIFLTFGGVVNSIVVAVGALPGSGAATLPVSVVAKDAANNTIISDNFTNPITLADSDTSGHTMLSSTTVTAPGTVVTIAFDGSGAFTSAVVSASASGVAAANVTAATLSRAGGAVPVTLPAANPASPSTLAVNSNPAGLAISVDGAAGSTPFSSTPGYGSHTVVVTPKTAAAPYSVTFSNTGAAAASVFYNQVADSSGKVSAGIATSSIATSRSVFRVPNRTPQRSAVSFSDRPAFADGKIAVQYDASAFRSGRTFAAVEEAHGVTRAQTLVQSASRITRVVTLSNGTDIDAALASLRRENGVVDASRVGLRYPAASSKGTVYPNDTYFMASNNGANADQWYLWLVDLQDAWGYGQGKAPLAIVDTGYDPAQTDLASLVTSAQTIVNLLSYANVATDTDGHGTFVSGVADAITNNGGGFAGAAYNAPLQEYKIFADGSSSAQTTDEAAAIRAAVANGAKVILLALQSNPANGPDPVERDAVAFAIQSGVTVVAASGDDNGAALDYPAAYPGVISVGASIVNDAGTPGTVTGQGNSEAVAAYSNAGPGVGLVAPGGQGTNGDTDVLHWIEGLNTTQPAAGSPACAAGTAPPDCRILFTGTSPAAALVAGTASLMLTVNPSLTSSQVAQLLYASTDDIKDSRQGHGRLNAQRAVALAAGDPNAQPGLPLPRAVQLTAIAYTNSGATLPAAPAIFNTTYKAGVPVNADGTFRIADINPASLPAGVTTYKIAVWLSLAGDGKVHAGDYFTSVSCSINASCSASIANLTLVKLPASATVLP